MVFKQGEYEITNETITIKKEVLEQWRKHYEKLVLKSKTNTAYYTGKKDAVDDLLYTFEKSGVTGKENKRLKIQLFIDSLLATCKIVTLAIALVIFPIVSVLEQPFQAVGYVIVAVVVLYLVGIALIELRDKYRRANNIYQKERKECREVYLKTYDQPDLISIGNWYLVDGKPTKVTRENINAVMAAPCEPMTLTGDILEKIGFRNVLSRPGERFEYELDLPEDTGVIEYIAVIFEEDKNETVFLSSKTHQAWTIERTVHELQNMMRKIYIEKDIEP